MQHVNLLDASLLPPQPRLPAAWLLGTALLGALAVGAHGAWERHRFALAVAAPPAAVEAQDASSGSAAAPDELQRKVEQARQLVDVLQGGRSLTQDAAGTLSQVLAAVPESLWLSELELDGARGLRVAGGALDPAALAAFAARLSQVSALRGRAIETLRLVHEPAAEGEDAAPARHRFVLASEAAPATPGSP